MEALSAVMDQMSGQKLVQSGTVQAVDGNVQTDCSVFTSTGCVREAPSHSARIGQTSHQRLVQSGIAQEVSGNVQEDCNAYTRMRYVMVNH